MASGYGAGHAGGYPVDSYSQPGHVDPYNGGYSSVEMNNLNGQPSFLDECEDARRTCRALEAEAKSIQQRRRDLQLGSDPRNKDQVDADAEQLTNDVRSLGFHVNELRRRPEAAHSQNQGHLQNTVNQVKELAQTWWQYQSEMREQLQGDLVRQYKLINPEVSDVEAVQAVQSNDGGQMFAQAVMDKTKFKYQGGVQTAIDQRQEMRSVAKQMTILMELNQQLGEMVVAQQPVIEKVAETGDTVNNDFDHGNKDVGGAISSAKARNRKKMWCFLLALLIIIIIVVIVVVVYFVTRNKTPK